MTLDPLDRLLRLLHRHLDSPPSGQPWDLANCVRRGGTHYWVDGWLSRSNSRHLAQLHRSHVAQIDQHWRPRINAHSYFGPGQTYQALDTTRAIQRHTAKLTGLLRDKVYGRTKWVITAYSMGAVITTIALGQLVQQSFPLRSRVPLVVLLEPALYGSERLFAYYLQVGEVPREISQAAIIMQLGSPDNPHPREARQAVKAILDAGVGIAVIHCPEGELVPYTPIDDPRILHCPLRLDDQEEDAPLRIHFGVRNDPTVHGLIHKLAKPSLTLYKRRSPTLPPA